MLLVDASLGLLDLQLLAPPWPTRRGTSEAVAAGRLDRTSSFSLCLSSSILRVSVGVCLSLFLHAFGWNRIETGPAQGPLGSSKWYSFVSRRQNFLTLNFCHLLCLLKKLFHGRNAATNVSSHAHVSSRSFRRHAAEINIFLRRSAGVGPLLSWTAESWSLFQGLESWQFFQCLSSNRKRGRQASPAKQGGEKHRKTIRVNRKSCLPQGNSCQFVCSKTIQNDSGQSFVEPASLTCLNLRRKRSKRAAFSSFASNCWASLTCSSNFAS